MELKKFREQYPEYDGVGDQELTDGFYKKFYSDMPRREFDDSIGYAPRGAELNFVQRYLEPTKYPAVDNGDGSISTHLMSSAEIGPDGERQYIAYPNVVQLDQGSVVKLEPQEAFDYAMETGEYLDFQTDEEAKAYAENGYKSMWGYYDGAEIDFLEPEPPAFNKTRAMGARAANLLGGLFETVATGAEAIESKLNFGGFVFDSEPRVGGNIFMDIPRYVGPKEWAELNVDQPLGQVADKLSEVGLGYVPEHTWEEVKNSFEDGEGEIGAVLNYGLEQGFQSIPDMAAVILNFPGYVLARSGEMGEQRARNSNRTDATLPDVMKAFPAALGSAVLERIAPGQAVDNVAASFGREMLESGFRHAAVEIGKQGLKTAGTEAITEFVQEGIIEYLGEQYGTDAEMSVAEGAERGLAGAVAGSVIGGGLGAGSEAAGQMNPIVRRAKDMIDRELPSVDSSQISAIELEEYQMAAEHGLDLSAEARMDRAQEMGFDTETVYYKGMYPYDWTKEEGDYKGPEITEINRPGDFPAFNGDEPGVQIAGFITTDPDVANRFAGMGREGAVYPLYFKSENMFTIDAKGEPAANVQFFESGKPFRDAIRSGNYDAIKIKNTSDEGTIVVALNPANLRSVHAAFDPEFGTSPDIMAADQPIKTKPGTYFRALQEEGVDFNDETSDAPMPGYIGLIQSGDQVFDRPANDILTVAGRKLKVPPLETPIRAEGIRQQLKEIIGARLYNDKIKSRTALGFYRRSNSEVRIGNMNDVEVMAHEMAHYLDFHKPFNGVFTKLRDEYKDDYQQYSYTEDPRLVKSEGFAEFLRLWLTQYDKIKHMEGTAAFEELIAQDPKLNKQMIKLQDNMHLWYHQGPGAMLRASSGEQLTVGQKIRRWFQTKPLERFRQRFLDRMHTSKVIERTTTGRIADASKSMFKQFQMINGTESMGEAIVQNGTPYVKPDGSYGYVRDKNPGFGLSLNEVFADVMKHGYKRFMLFMDYAKARRGKELMSQGRENAMNQTMIDAGLEYGKQYPEFVTAFNKFQQFNSEMLEFYVQMGLISDSARGAFQEMNANYMPFHRIRESLEEGKVGGGQSIGARLTGGSMNTREMAENIINGLYSNVRAALEARAKANMYKGIMTSQDGSLFAAEITKDTERVQTEVDQHTMNVAQTMAGLGLTISADGQIMVGDPEAEQITDISEIRAYLKSHPELLSFFRKVPPTTHESYVDTVKLFGEDHYFEVIDQNLVEMLTGMRGFRSGIVLRGMYRIKNLQTRTVTSLLQFLGPNAVRDTTSGTVISENNFIPIWTTLKGMGHFMVNSKVYKDFALNGGGYGTRIEARTEEGRSRQRLDLPASSGWDYVAKGLAKYDRFVSAFEYGSRVGEFQAARAQGKNDLQAAFEAREVSTDFAKMGNEELWTKILRTIPFMNAGLQGLDKTARKIVEIDGEITFENIGKMNDEKALFMMKGLGAVTTMTALLWMLNQDDERYQALTSDQKARFWWVFLDPDKKPIKIPRPYDIGHIFATLPEIALDYIADKEGTETAKNLAWVLNTTLGIGDYPGLIQPFIELARNEKFTGAPVVPFHLEDLPAEYQFIDRTPIIYREMGERLGISPIKAEHLARGFLRYLEQIISDTTENMFWRKDQWGERPFARGLGSGNGPIDAVFDYLSYQFVGQKVPFRTKWTEGYWDMKQRAAAATQAKGLLEDEFHRDGGERLTQYLSDDVTQAFIALNGAFGTIDTELGKGRELLVAIRYNPNMPVEEKEAKIDEYYRQKNDILSQFYIQAERQLNLIEKELRQ